MATKPKCANCNEDYSIGHRWAGGDGACKRPKSGTRTVYRDPSTPVQPARKAGA